MVKGGYYYELPFWLCDFWLKGVVVLILFTKSYNLVLVVEDIAIEVQKIKNKCTRL